MIKGYPVKSDAPKAVFATTMRTKPLPWHAARQAMPDAGLPFGSHTTYIHPCAGDVIMSQIHMYAQNYIY